MLCYDRFSSFTKFWSSDRNTENTISALYFKEQSNYSEEQASDNEYFRSTILELFQFEPEQKKTGDNESHEKVTTETKHYNASAADLLRIRIGNLDWCKCGHGKNEARQTDSPSFVEKWVQCSLLQPKSWSAREASCHTGCMNKLLEC